MDESSERNLEQFVIVGEDRKRWWRVKQRDATLLRLMTAARRAGATQDQFHAIGRALNKLFPESLAPDELNRTLRQIEEFSGGPIGDGTVTLPFRTAKEMCEATVPAIPFVVRPHVPAAVKISLDGAVKDGKTTFVLCCVVRPAVTGSDPLGYGAEVPVTVLYCTEQPEASFTPALREAGLDREQRLHVLRIFDVGTKPWADIAAGIIAYAELVEAKLIVFDTFTRWARLRGDDENSAGASLAALEALDPAIGKGISVLLIRHTRKSGGGLGDAARGSSAVAGEVDVILGLRRSEARGASTERVVEAMGRIAEIPEKVTVRMVANPPIPGVSEWRQLAFELVDGEPDTSPGAARRQGKILDALTAAAAPLTREALIKATGVKDTTLRRDLEKLETDTRVISRESGGGERGTAIVYMLPPTSRQDPTPRGGELAGGDNGEWPEEFDHDPA